MESRNGVSHQLGANTWIWTSPLTDERLAELAPRIRAWGFDVIELPFPERGEPALVKAGARPEREPEPEPVPETTA